MAIGTRNNFVIYQDELRGGIVERLTQASAYFNSAGGAIRLTTVSRRGDYAKETFFKNIADIVARRVTTSVSAAADKPLAMDELISVKLNRRVGPVAQTLDAFKKVQMSAGEDALSFLIGTQVAKAMEVDMLNSALRAGVAALNNQSTVKHTVATSGTLGTPDLIDGMAKLGDAANRVVAWVMHSKPFFDLMKHQINPQSSGGEIALTSLQAANPLTLNRPVILTDSPSLVATGSPNDYYTLGLTADALVVENSEEESMVTDMVTGLDNLAVRLQGEFAFNLGVRGFKWDIANGAANPDDAALATGSNWDPAMTSLKDWAGVIIQSR